ncbi:hypothetical protein ACI68E_000830 [Malassezia pachydermatis]|uniref:J domain-containing protein n=1 Tax=Malassezia pachydermatis TaxID=77020 RepID=A0A0M8MWV2_9BASI|nr:hypothetical protein Malapachy_2664 [Malassezia pachydermatis]KOS15400.1 hypothetical protein Malapachy_2664 [Malassezia pachydermatis]
MWVASWRVQQGARRPAFRAAFSSSRLVHADERELDLYEVLGVPRDATKAQIKNQFYRLSKEHHPDVAKHEKGKDTFQRVSEAYATLSNDAQRRAYDRTLRTSTPSTSAASSSRQDTARYAWAYQRRAQAASQAASARYTPPGARASAASAKRSDDAAQRYTTQMYARMAEREARLHEARTRSGSYASPAPNPDSFRAWSQKRWSEEEHQAAMSSSTWRFLQVGTLLGGTLWLSHRLFS